MSNLINLRLELEKIIDEKEVFVLIIKLMSESSFDEENIGVNINNSEALNL